MGCVLNQILSSGPGPFALCLRAALGLFVLCGEGESAHADHLTPKHDPRAQPWELERLAFLSFLPHQIYHSAQGFGVNRHDAYEVVMVHHRPLHDPKPNHGMGNYLLYMTPGECQAQAIMSP